MSEMLDRIVKHIEERDSLIKELDSLMGYCDESPIHIVLDRQFSIEDDSLWIQSDNQPLNESKGNYYSYTISSLSNKGERLYLGEKDDLVFVLVYPEYGTWHDTSIVVFNIKNKVERHEKD